MDTMIISTTLILRHSLAPRNVNTLANNHGPRRKSPHRQSIFNSRSPSSCGFRIARSVEILLQLTPDGDPRHVSASLPPAIA